VYFKILWGFISKFGFKWVWFWIITILSWSVNSNISSIKIWFFFSNALLRNYTLFDKFSIQLLYLILNFSWARIPECMFVRKLWGSVESGIIDLRRWNLAHTFLRIKLRGSFFIFFRFHFFPRVIPILLKFCAHLAQIFFWILKIQKNKFSSTLKIIITLGFRVSLIPNTYNSGFIIESSLIPSAYHPG